MAKVGNALLELEIVLDKLVDQDLQMGDIIALVHMHLQVHRPDCIEEYMDGTHPYLYYGPKE